MSLDNNAHSISSSYSVINGKITRPSLVSVLDPSWFKSNSYYRSLNDDIIGIYNIFDNSIEYLDNNRSHQKAECLYIINPLEYPLDPANLPLDAIKKYNPNISFEFVGLFSSNTNSYCGEALVGDNIMYEIYTPIIFVVGVGPNSSKFPALLSVINGLKHDNFNYKAITYNPAGIMYDAEVINYDNEVSFPDTVYSLNSHIKRLEEGTQDYDCAVIDIGGGILPINRINTNDFGFLYKAYLSAVPVDLTIICINTATSTSSIISEINRIRSYGCSHFAIVVSNMTYEKYSLKIKDDYYTFFESDQEIAKKISEMKCSEPDLNVFSIKEIEDGSLYLYIKSCITK
ncbi:MAG: hypothetical protein LUG91_04010 [Ruminococcus sp.]|nr:hypothetical protein [Ruminococcus sp.]